jgi:cyclopropane fatty-acyl-phospholipid synthase-like methyltransferase
VTPSCADERNADQVAYWNGPAGRRWVQRQEEQDRLLAPVAEVLLDRCAARPGESVLDIGCGWGGIAVALARRVAPGGSSSRAEPAGKSVTRD